MAFGLAEDCRNPIDVDWRTVVVDDNNSRFDDLAQCFSVESLYWKRSGLLQQTQKTQIAFGLAGGLSKPD